MQGIRDYLKFIKRGYSRVSHLSSIDIRNGRLTREAGEKLVEEYEGKKPASLPVFLDYVGIEENEFYKYALQNQVDPFSLTREQINLLGEGDELWDQKLWYKEKPCQKNCDGCGN